MEPFQHKLEGSKVFSVPPQFEKNLTKSEANRGRPRSLGKGSVHAWWRVGERAEKGCQHTTQQQFLGLIRAELGVLHLHECPACAQTLHHSFCSAEDYALQNRYPRIKGWFNDRNSGFVCRRLGVIPRNTWFPTLTLSTGLGVDPKYPPNKKELNHISVCLLTRSLSLVASDLSGSE